MFLGAGLISFACAQQTNLSVIAPAGHSDQTDKIQIEWTMGELAIMSLETSDGYFTQGFHQPFIEVESMDLPNLNASEAITVTVRPNPVSAQLFIDFKSETNQPSIITLMSMDGRLLKMQKVEPGIGDLVWNLADYPVGIYLLSLRMQDGTLVKSFKIVKNQ